MSLRASIVKPYSIPHKIEGLHHEKDENLVDLNARYPVTVPQAHMLYLTNKNEFEGFIDNDLIKFFGYFKRHAFFLFSNIDAHKGHRYEFYHDDHGFGQRKIVHKDSEVVLSHICFKNLKKSDVQIIRKYMWDHSEKYPKYLYFSIEEDPLLTPFFIKFKDEDVMYYGDSTVNVILYFK